MRRWRIALLPLVVTGLLSPGCGREAAHPQADSEKARQALTIALDGWQKGRTELAFAGQPIKLRDDRFTARGQLLSYKVNEEQAYGNQRQFRVALRVRDKKGQSRAEQATYNVQTEPSFVISRLEDD